jgi:hypothetical protein
MAHIFFLCPAGSLTPPIAFSPIEEHTIHLLLFEPSLYFSYYFF